MSDATDAEDARVLDLLRRRYPAYVQFNNAAAADALARLATTGLAIAYTKDDEFFGIAAPPRASDAAGDGGV